MKQVKRVFAILLCALWIGMPSRLPVCFAVTKADVQQVIESILSYKCRSVGAANVSALIDGDLTANAGITADWYVFGLKQYGFPHDYSGFSDSLKRFAGTNEVESPVTDERLALVFAALGTEPDFIAQVTDSAIGALGVMSYVFGLHLLNNGYASRQTDANAVVSELLDMQKTDGGWAVMGDVGDVDVTAMTLAALAPYYRSDKTVKAAADKALALLSSRQQASGGYKAFGQESPESAAQVIVALTSLGIDPLSAPDFIKNGNTAYDAMLSFLLPDGSFEHAHEKGYNHTATVQAFYSSVALWRFQNGQAGLYVLQPRQAAAPAPATEKPAPTTQPTSAKPETTKPAATQPTTAKPSTTKPTKPTTTKPTTTKPTTTKPTTTKPAATTQPTTISTTAVPPQTTLSPQTAVTTTLSTTVPEPTGTTAADASAATGKQQEAVSVIRPEKGATLPDYDASGHETETEQDVPEQTDRRAAVYVTAAIGASLLAAAGILFMRRKKRAAAA